MKIYNKIKKEHLFIFLVLFTALVLFTYFDNSFNYTGLTTKNICTDKGYECCTEGKGTNYFSLDYSCPQDKECWSSCSKQVKEFNLITSSAVLDSVWNPIKDFFMNLFKREVRGVSISNCCLCIDESGDSIAYTVHSNEVSNKEECRTYCTNQGQIFDEEGIGFRLNSKASDNQYYCTAEGTGNQLPNCPSGYNEIISFSDDGHASLNVNQYPNKICSNELIKVAENIQVNQRIKGVISLSEDYTHVSRYTDRETDPDYTYERILKVEPISQNTNLIISHTNYACPTDYKPLFSISEDYNADLGEHNEFNIKVCYNIPQGRGAVCGNERIETGEECEFILIEGGRTQENLNEKSCRTEGFTGGDLHCYPINSQNECKFDIGRCTGPRDQTPPTVSITFPQPGTQITGTITITANANDNTGVSNVQFKIDGENFGDADTSQPYSISWNSATAVNGQHVITAIAKDAANNLGNSQPVTVNVNNPGGGGISQFTQSDYEVYWANDKVVALSFNKYIQRNSAQLPNIAKFKVYRSTIRGDLITNNNNKIITILKKSTTSGKAIRDYRGTVETGTPGYEDDKYDFWDDYPNNQLTDGTSYYYKIVPVNSSGREYSNENSIIQITPQATRNDITVSGQCSGISYGLCSTNKPQYCGYGDNLVNNSGFDSDFTLWNKYSEQFTIQTVNNHLGELSKTAYIDVSTPTPQDIYSLSQTAINIKPDTYYRLSAYIKAENIDANNKPLLYVDCISDRLSDGKQRKFLSSLNSLDVAKRPNININEGNWANYNYIFRTYKGSNKCSIYPIYFQENSKGKVWIDGVRLEEIGQASAQAITFNDDCGICGCPSGNSCLVNGGCGIIPPAPREETCDPARKTVDDDGDGIIALFDSDCATTFDNLISIEEVIPSADQAYTSTTMQVSCNYNIKNSAGDEKNLLQESYIKECINAYLEPITDAPTLCEDKVTKTRDNSVLFRKCNVGEIPNEETPVICEINERCAVFTGEEAGEAFISITEYPYCSEISEGIVEFVENSIRLNTANEPGEELKVSGKIKAAEPGTITIEAALINLENGQILKENSADIEYTSNTQQQKSFEVKFIIPSIVTKNYFVFVKAYAENDEPNSCIQASKQLRVISDLTEGDVEFEGICNDFVDNDNDDLVDCEDDDCSTDISCTGQCQEGASCNTNLPGVCSVGTQRCLEDDSFGECTPLVQPGQRQETSGNGLDDDCNGNVDETGAQPSADSDNDGLLDSWEYENFNTLLYNANDDPDNDGVSNIEEYNKGTNPNIPDKKKINLTWLWIILGIIIAVILIFILFKFLAKPKGPKISRSYTDPRLTRYIQDSLRKGFTKQQIRQALLSKGWSQKDIDKALK